MAVFCGRASNRSFRPTILATGFLAAALFGIAAVSAEAQTPGPSTDPQSIRAAIAAAIQQAAPPDPQATLDASIQPLDPSLHLAACGNLSVTLPPLTNSHITAKVSCAAPSWAIYVPVQLHRWQTLLVAAMPLNPNQPLVAADLETARVDAASLPGMPVTTMNDALGKLLRTSLPAGAPLLAAQLEAPVAIHRDERVVLTLEDGNITIKTTAIAEQDGRAGDTILLQNSSSKKSLRATVTGDGEATMHL